MTRRVLLGLLLTCFWVLTGCNRGNGSADGQADAAASGTASSELSAAGPTKISILTGSKSGNYYKAATELSQALGEGFVLDIQQSAGSFDNISKLGTGEVDLAIAQFDTVKVFLKLEDKHRRMAEACAVIAPLAYEHVHILVSKSSGINEPKDLAGKKLSVGPEHSGSWISAWSLMFHLNKVNIETATHIEKLSYPDSIAKLRDGKLDGMFVTTALGMPFLKAQPADLQKKVRLLSLSKGFAVPPGATGTYTIKPIPAGTYRWQPTEVLAFATPSYLLANRKLSKPLVRRIAAALYGQADLLANKSLLWTSLSRERVARDIYKRVPYHLGVKAHLGL
jgi:TRAP transporter TAXI family solute receptor